MELARREALSGRGTAAAGPATVPRQPYSPRGARCWTYPSPTRWLTTSRHWSTRRAGRAPYSELLAGWLRWGASPRAAIAIERGARALAWLDGRDYVSPEDVQAIAPDALRHRLLLDYTAQAARVTAQDCVDELLRQVSAP
ncbi:MAG: hypothetical protein V9G29_05225 [Burkholderiaceae bacterium]